MLIQAQMRVYDHQAASAAAIETVAFRTDAVLTSEDKLDAMKVGVDNVAECARALWPFVHVLTLSRNTTARGIHLVHGGVVWCVPCDPSPFPTTT